MSDDDVVLRPQEGSQELALNCTADVVIYGGAAGSGKSHLMLMRALMQVEDPHYNAIVFRRTTTTLRDGLWGEAKQMYRPWKKSIQEQPMRMEFESGAVIKFNHMEHDKHAENDHQGKQYSLICFDEGTQFSEYQIQYLMSRMRSAAEGNSQMFISCNPDPDSFLCQWIDWWLDDDGYPLLERSGKERYYCTINGELKFADTEEELFEQWSDYLKVWNPRKEEWVITKPKRMCFIAGTIFDNPALIEANPQYLATLNALPPIEKARLLDGNWYIRPEGSSHYKRGWVKKASRVPDNAVYCRAWDKASTKPSDANKYPDFTACIKMAKCKNGDFYIVGDFHPDCHDEKDPTVMGRFRETSGARNIKIERQAHHDGVNCTVVLPQDPGAAGATEYQEASKALITLGFKVKKDPMPTANSKLVRFSPFSSACENGIVYIVESTFNPTTLESFHKELEAFDGERSTKLRKDDRPDCTATAFNHLCRTQVLPSITLKDLSRRDPFIT